MKRQILALAAILLLVQGAAAQAYTNSRYYNPNTGQLDYNKRAVVDRYYGFRIGPAFSGVDSDEWNINSKTGLHVAFAYGIGLTAAAPLYFETGFSYTEKGGKNTQNGSKWNYSVNYLELPFVLKYAFDTEVDLEIQPFLGGYIACGVGGKVKDFANKVSYDSFSNDYFRRFDAGLRFGCGLQYNVAYVEIAYELGLANVGHDDFDTVHNHAWVLSFGVNF